MSSVRFLTVWRSLLMSMRPQSLRLFSKAIMRMIQRAYADLAAVPDLLVFGGIVAFYAWPFTSLFRVMPLITFFLCCLIRSSVTLKDRYYMYQCLSFIPRYAKTCGLALVVMLGVYALMQSIAVSYRPMIFGIAIACTPLAYIIIPLLTRPELLLISPLFVFITFFLMDSGLDDVRAKSSLEDAIVRGIKMSWYLHPLCVVLFSVLALFLYLGRTVIAHHVLYASAFCGIVLVPWISFLCTLYKTQVHTYYALYYPDKRP